MIRKVALTLIAVLFGSAIVLSAYADTTSDQDFSIIGESKLMDTSRQLPIVLQPNISEEQIQINKDGFFTKLLDIYNAANATDTQIIKDLDTFSHQTIVDFFKNYKNYDPSSIEELDIPYTTARSHDAPTSYLPFEVMGVIETSNYYNDTKTIPVNGIKVCAYDYSPKSDRYIELELSDEKPACIYTTPFGKYHITNIVNDDPEDNTRVDLAVGVLALGASDLTVSDSNGKVYTQFAIPTANFTNTESALNVALEGPQAGAGRIIDSMSDARDFFINYTSPQKLDVIWQQDKWVGFIDLHYHMVPSYYDYDDNKIILNGNVPPLDDDSKVRYTLLNQFGHHLSDILNATSNVDDTNPIPNADCETIAVNRHSSANCAFYDGLAAFVPHLVDNSETMQSTLAGDIIDIENGYILSSDDETIPFTRVIKINGVDRYLGQIVSGQIAGTLWDIKDPQTDDDSIDKNVRDVYSDNLSLGHDEIITLLTNANLKNFEDFYDAWELTNHTSSTSVMNLHFMDFALPVIPVKFDAAQSSIDIITLDFDRTLDVPLTVNDFIISNGNITNVDTVDDPQIILNVTGIDYYTDVTVKYVGETIEFPDSYSLLNNEESTADGIPGPVQNLTAIKAKYSFTIMWDDDGATQYNVRVLEPGFFDERTDVTTSDNFITVGDLKPWIKYKIIVYPDDNFELKNEIQKFTKPAPKLEGLKVTPDDDSIEISWDDHPDADEYVVRVIEHPDGYRDRIESTTTNNTITVEDLEFDREYRVVVLPNGHEQPKASQHITLLESVQNLKATVTNSTITATWDDDFDEYDVRVYQADSLESSVITSDTTYTKTGLMNYTNYTIMVIPDGAEDRKAMLEIKTQPNKPQNLVVNVTHNTITATWSDDFDSYEVRVFPVGQFTPGKIITESTYTINTLTPDTEYKIVIVPDGDEDKKTIQRITTLLLPIENLLVTPTATSLEISWDPHDGTSEYTVRVIEQPTGTSDRLEYTVSDTSKTVDNLNPNTEYRVVVLPKDTPQSKTAQHITTLQATES